MSDRTSAALFGEIFDLLAENPTDEHKAIAKKIWAKTGEFDFSPYQIGADESLEKLGLSKMGVNRSYPEDGYCRLYYPFDDFDEDIIMVCDACGKEKQADLDHCPCYEGEEWIIKQKQ